MNRVTFIESKTSRWGNFSHSHRRWSRRNKRYAQLVPRDLTLEWPLPLAGGSPSLLPLSGYLRIVTLTALRREIIELSEEWEKMSEAAGREVGGE